MEGNISILVFVWAVGSLLLFVYGIWLFFFPIIIVRRLNKIIKLMEEGGNYD